MMRYHHDVRTTVDLDDDILAAARSLARAQGRSMGAVLSALARRGLADDTQITAPTGGFPVFDVPAGGRPITSEMVRAAQDEVAEA
jgi:hypothetical protein